MFQEKLFTQADHKEAFPLTSDLKSHELCFGWMGDFEPLESDDVEIAERSIDDNPSHENIQSLSN
jgi:hypothetical protein